MHNTITSPTISGNTTEDFVCDGNGNQITRNVGGQYTLTYDAENRLLNVSGPSLTAAFQYDPDGNRVKSIINGVYSYFIGAHYEVTGAQVTKYYFARMQRVVTLARAPGVSVRKYTIPQSMTVEYLVSIRLRYSTPRLGDHLGFTSITTDNTGARVLEMRYKP